MFKRKKGRYSEKKVNKERKVISYEDVPLDDYEQDFLDSLSPDDLVRLPGYDQQKTMYEGTEYTHKVNGRHASVDPTDYCIANE